MKELKVNAGGAVVSTQLDSKVSKEDLYGQVVTIVEKDGRRLELGYLTPDGQMLRRGQIANAAVDPEGTAVESPATYLDEQPATLANSSFDTEVALKAAPLTRLVDLNVADVYPLEGTSLTPGLYETTFNYRKSYLPKDALVLVKEGSAFLLVGTFKRAQLVGKNQAYEFFDAPAEEAEEDPLDFSMM